MLSATAVDVAHVIQGLSIPRDRAQAVIDLLDAGNTVPFITRYRKDQTGGLDEEQIRQIQERALKLRLLLERKQTILRSIESQGRLTPELAAAIEAADTTRRLEDLYLPYKPKKQTLATQARERGLEKLAEEILAADPACADLDVRARDFVNPDKKVINGADALLGAGHILAELFSERADLRGKLRAIFERTGALVTTAIEPEAVVPAKAEQSTTDAPATDANPAESVTETADVEANAAEVVAEVSPETSAATDEVAATDEPTAEAEEPHVAEAVAPEPVEPSSEAAPEAAATQAEGVAAETAPVPAVAHETPAPARPKRERKKKKGKEKGKEKAGPDHRAFRDYFSYREAIAKVPPHRTLAINRAERAKAIRVKVEVDSTATDVVLNETLVPAGHPHADFLRGCAQDALQRLILPSLEREVRRELTDAAESHAVTVFARNLRNLLLQPPVRGRRVLAVDPGYKSGCKLVVIDEFGNVLDHNLIHVIGKEERRAAGKAKLIELVTQHEINTIVIGNGTACRDTERVVSDILNGELLDKGITYVIVNEAGASVYSTSTIGRQEFPQHDATVRGAVSIGRRLQDPLSELVKIDAANLGVGLYQHDVKVKHLRDSLDAVVESCVNFVGVDLNTASPALLRYVSGLNQLTAQRLYDHRQANGPFRTREQLKQVSGVGDTTFVQAAGFLKIASGDQPLDATWIHPESYQTAEQILSKLGFTTADLQDKEKVAQLAEKVAQIDPRSLASEVGVGEMTLRDILVQLARPGRDPRESLPPPIFKKGILKLDDLAPGLELDGTVLNVVDFGAFVDIGLKDSGLVHISQLADKYVQDPHDVAAVGDIVKVWVLEVDKQRRRVSLTMIKPGSRRPAEPRRPRGEEGPAASRPPRPPRSEGNRPPQPRPPRPQGAPAQSAPPPPRPPRPAPPPPPPAPSRPKKKDHSVAAMLTQKVVKKKSLKKKQLTQDQQQGKASLNSFGDLKALWNMKHGKANDGESR